MPTGTPTTLAAVKVQLKLTDESEDDRLAPKVAAANAVVVGLPVAQGLPEAGAWPANIIEGATLLAVRLYRRKNSPAGKERIGADSAIMVAQSDPDLALLLELGAYERPSVG